MAEGLKDWNDLREVALSSLRDAVECVASIEIVEKGNAAQVVGPLSDAGAFLVALHIRDATLFRLHMIVCRAFARVTHPDDRHLRTAIDFLRRRVAEETDPFNRQELQRAVSLFDALADDPRLAKLTRMRNKLLAHIAKPKEELGIATYSELFGVTKAAVEIWYALARGANVATLPLDYFLEEYRDSLNAFWERWSEPPSAPLA